MTPGVFQIAISIPVRASPGLKKRLGSHQKQFTRHHSTAGFSFGRLLRGHGFIFSKSAIFAKLYLSGERSDVDLELMQFRCSFSGGGGGRRNFSLPGRPSGFFFGGASLDDSTLGLVLSSEHDFTRESKSEPRDIARVRRALFLCTSNFCENKINTQFLGMSQMCIRTWRTVVHPIQCSIVLNRNQ